MKEVNIFPVKPTDACEAQEREEGGKQPYIYSFYSPHLIFKQR